MGKYQAQIRATLRKRTKSIRAVLYPYDEQTARAISVNYQEDPRHPEDGRYISAEPELRQATAQSYIHDIIVDVKYAHRPYTFHIFFKRHVTLGDNQAILALRGATKTFDGDVLVAVIGRNGCVNLTTALQRRAANRAVKELAKRLAPMRSRRRFPARISL
ncbi:hypothetical protein EV715DRAFT_298081 [Schizophyllum commune]